MGETRKQVEVAKEQSVRLVNLEEEVVNLRLERDKYKRFWLEVKAKAKAGKAELDKKKQTVKLVNFDHVPLILDRDKYKKLLQSLKKRKNEKSSAGRQKMKSETNPVNAL